MDKPMAATPHGGRLSDVPFVRRGAQAEAHVLTRDPRNELAWMARVMHPLFHWWVTLQSRGDVGEPVWR